MADWMRATVDSTLGPARAIRQIRTETRTPTGGRTYTWADAAESYCNIAPMTSDEMELASKMAVSATVACRVSASVDFDPHDRVRIVDAGPDELQGTWEITAVLAGYPFVDRLLYLSRVTDE